jgi:hypothetical protein
MPSLNLQRYLQTRADGGSIEDACAASGIGAGEARLHEKDIERGELTLPRARAHARTRENPIEEVEMANGTVAADELRLLIERIERLQSSARWSRIPGRKRRRSWPSIWTPLVCQPTTPRSRWPLEMKSFQTAAARDRHREGSLKGATGSLAVRRALKAKGMAAAIAWREKRRCHCGALAYRPCIHRPDGLTT